MLLQEHDSGKKGLMSKKDFGKMYDAVIQNKEVCICTRIP